MLLVVQLCEYTKNCLTVQFKRVSFMICEISLNKTNQKKKVYVLREQKDLRLFFHLFNAVLLLLGSVGEGTSLAVFPHSTRGPHVIPSPPDPPEAMPPFLMGQRAHLTSEPLAAQCHPCS